MNESEGCVCAFLRPFVRVFDRGAQKHYTYAYIYTLNKRLRIHNVDNDDEVEKDAVRGGIQIRLEWVDMVYILYGNTRAQSNI